MDDKFEKFFKLQEYGSRAQLLSCWKAAQAAAKDEMKDFISHNLTFYQLSEGNRQRQRTVFRQTLEWTPADWITAITGELGEAANFIKKKKRGDGDLGILDIVKELADVIVYTDILIQFYNYDTGAVVASKFDEISERVGSDVKLLPERCEGIER